MSKTVKIEVLDAIIDGKRKGAVLDVEASSAAYLAKIRYAKIIEDAKKNETTAQTKAPPAKSRAKAPAKKAQSKAPKAATKADVKGDKKNESKDD